MSEEKWPGPPSSQSGEPKSQLRQQRGAGGGGAQAAVSHQGQGELHICMTVPHYVPHYASSPITRPPLHEGWGVGRGLGRHVWGTWSGGRCVRTLLPGLRQEPPPHVRLLRAPPGGLGNGRGLHAKNGGQGPAGMAEDLHPEIGEAGAGLLDGEPAAPPAQPLAGQTDVAADACHQALESQPRGPGGLGRLHRAPECLDELAEAPDRAGGLPKGNFGVEFHWFLG